MSDVFRSDKWKNETGAYTALTQKTNGALYFDVGSNETTPFTVTGINPYMNIVADNGAGALNVVGISSFGSGGFFDLGSLVFFNRARGTQAAPSAIQNGDYIGGQVFGGYGSGDYQLAVTGLLAQSIADWDITPGAMNLSWVVNATPVFTTDSTTSATTAYFPWQFDGNVGIASGSASTPQFFFSGDTDTGLFLNADAQFGITTGGVASAIFSDGTSSTSFLELAPTDRTLTSNYTTGIQYLINVDNTYTLNTSTAVAPIMMNNAQTAIFATDGFAYGSAFSVWNHMLIQNDSASTRTTGGIGGYIEQTNIQANGGSLTTAFYSAFLAQPTFNRINSGTLTITAADVFWSQAPTIGAGTTVTRYNHFTAANAANSGTLTTQVGLNVPELTSGTNNTHVLIGTATTGDWGIYQSTTTANSFGGIVQIPDGSAANPSFTFNSDLDTGIHWVTTNQFSLDAGGVSRVQISSLQTVVNPGKVASGDFIVHGDTVDNLIQTDASADALGFYNATPVAQSTGWTVTNETSDKVLDADSTTLDEVADVLGTLIETLKTVGILGG